MLDEHFEMKRLSKRLNMKKYPSEFGTAIYYNSDWVVFKHKEGDNSVIEFYKNKMTDSQDNLVCIYDYKTRQLTPKGGQESHFDSFLNDTGWNLGVRNQ